MTKPMITIHNSATGEIVEREMNTQELEQYETDKANDLLKAQTEATKAAAKAELLAKLGITAEEAALLLA